MYAQWCVQFSSTNRSRAWPLYTVLLYIVQFWGCKKHTDIKPYRLIRFFYFLIFTATKVLYFFHGIGFIFFLTTMILYVSQAKISLRRQSVIGRASDCTVCRIVPVVCLFTISRSTVFFFLLYACYILSLQKLTYRLICFFVSVALS